MKNFILIFILFISATVHAENYKNLQCKIVIVRSKGEMMIYAKETLNMVNNKGEFTLVIDGGNIPDDDPMTMTITLSQIEGMNDVLNIKVRTSDRIGLSITSQMLMVDTEKTVTGFFRYNSEVHPTVAIQCIASK